MPESIWDAEVQNTLEAEERGSNTMANQEHLDILKQGVQIWNQTSAKPTSAEPTSAKPISSEHYSCTLKLISTKCRKKR
jgi:hypothetical protein